ncbi:DUF4097 family beta strand repeat-containing protein [Streptomyces racemochromogenes]|uniref:DUF4097 family beta strand repeat-containing protein n=1 Tax=Streptomyces racemochromogenes TaxID=67353 RepID=A0ABW7PCW9_9ACTN
MQTFATATPVSAVLDIPAGRVQLIASDRTDATVEVRPADPSKGRDVKAAELIEVAYTDGVLRVVAADAKNRITGNSGFVDVTLQLPADSHVEAKLAAGEVRGKGRLGDFVLEAAQAEVKLDATAAVRVTVQSGDVSLGRVGGPAEVSTQKGEITIAEATAGVVTLTTQHGNITVGAARGVAASLDAGTGYGRISNALQSSEGTVPLNIQATTAYGDITARTI